jgi:hypothetical protein
MAATAVLVGCAVSWWCSRGSRRGVLLICDAWFDIMTASRSQMWESVLTAALGNLPLAAILISGALRIQRLTATRLWFLDPETSAWRLPLVP